MPLVGGAEKQLLQVPIEREKSHEQEQVVSVCGKKGASTRYIESSSSFALIDANVETSVTKSDGHSEARAAPAHLQLREPASEGDQFRADQSQEDRALSSDRRSCLTSATTKLETSSLEQRFSKKLETAAKLARFESENNNFHEIPNRNQRPSAIISQTSEQRTNKAGQKSAHQVDTLSRVRSLAIKMDSQARSAKPNQAQGQSDNGELATNRPSPSPHNYGQQQPSQTSSIPSYNSIFNSTHHQHQHQRQQSPPKATDLDEELLSSSQTGAMPKQRWSPLLAQQNSTRAPLRKQTELSHTKRLMVFNYEAPAKQSSVQYRAEEKLQSMTNGAGCDSSSESNGSLDDQDDELMEETSERLPFNKGPKNSEREQNNKQAPGSTLKTTNARLASNCSKGTNNLNSANLNGRKQQHHQQTKISAGAQLDEKKRKNCNKKFDLEEQVSYSNCDCKHCANSRKLSGFVQGHGVSGSLAAPTYYHHHHHNQQQQHQHHLHSSGELSKSNLLIEKSYPKTRVMHLVLKSIILVLCTLLLILLLVGTAMITVTLPQAVDKITNVSRSFNVTIAGGR